MRVLVTFAVEAEFAPWRRRHSFKRAEIVIPNHQGKGDVVYRGRMEGADLDVYLTGIGWSGVKAGLYHMMSNKPDLCITAGLAGGLKPELRSGEIVAAREVFLLNGGGKVRSRRSLVKLAEESGATVVESFLTNTQVVSQAEFKRSMAEFGDVVEMESFHIMTMTSGPQIPSIAIRAISDTADEDLPLDFGRAIGADGQLSFRQLLLQAGRYPHKIPAIMSFGKRSEQAARNLAEFLDKYLATVRKHSPQWSFEKEDTVAAR